MKLFGIPIKVEIPFFAITLFLGLSRSREIALIVEWIAVVFVSILLHEFGHALAARAFGLAPEIRLYQMGGLTSWRSEVDLPPLKQLAISLAGPVMGFLLGGLILLTGPLLLRASPSQLMAVAYFDLLWVNIGWGVFNLLPLLPMDGGQVLVTLEAWILKRKDQVVSHVVSFLVALAITAAAFSLRAVWIGFLGIFFAYLNGHFLFQKLQTYRDRKLRFDLDQAKEAIARNELDLAADLITKVQTRAKAPQTKREVSHILVVVYLRQEKLDRAEEELRRYSAFFGGDPYLQGALHFSKGEMAEALPHAQAAFGHYQDQEVGKMLYKILVGMNDFTGALDLCRHPAMTEVSWNLLVDLQAEAFHREAFKVAAEAGTRAYAQKADARIAYNVACAFSRDSQVKEALVWVRHALDSGFSDKDALLSDPDLNALRTLPEFSSLVATFESRNT